MIASQNLLTLKLIMSKKIKSIKLKKDFPNNIWEENTEIDLFDYLQDDGSLLSDEIGRIYPEEYPEFFEIEYEIGKYAVHTPTQADFDELMRLYKIAGWEKSSYGYGQDTAVNFDRYGYFAHLKYQIRMGYTILNLEEARQKLQGMFPNKDFSEKTKQIFYGNGSCILPLQECQKYLVLLSEEDFKKFSLIHK